MVNQVIFFLTLFFPFLASSIPIGSNCSLSSIFCGSSSIERLVCDNGICKGGYLNNNCGSSQPCASTLFCNSGGICDKCPAGCNICGNQTNCFTCLPGYILSNGTCISLPLGCLLSTLNATYCTTCNSSYYLSNGQCKNCPYNCLNCTTQSTCLQCAYGFYWDFASSQCLPGVSNCVSATTATNCNLCAAGFYYYLDSSNVASCNQGPVNCSCAYPVATCKACRSGYLLNTPASNICPATNTANSCSQYSVSNCLLSVDGIGCYMCNSGYLLHNNCSVPQLGCQIAASVSTCQNCQSGYYLSNGTCYPCYIQSGTTNSTSSPCSTCIGPLRNQCTGCKSGYVFVSSINYGCQPCAPNCLTCTVNGPGNCDTGACAPGFYQAGNNTNSMCLRCDSSCTTCSGPSNAGCTACASNYTNYTSGGTTTCCPICNAGYFAFANTGSCACLICSPSSNCSTCNITATNCTSCPQTLPFYFSSAAGTCTTGTAIPNCVYFNGTSSTVQCISCSIFNLPRDDGVACVYSTVQNCAKVSSLNVLNCSSCTPGYAPSTNTSCVPCTSPCGTCSGNTAVALSNCTSCIANTSTNYYYYTAPVGITSGYCTQCAANCLNCTTTACSTCNSGYYPSGAICVLCPTGAICTTASVISSCQSGYSLTWDNSTCLPIPTSANCIFTNATSSSTGFQGYSDRCTTCASGYTLAVYPGNTLAYVNAIYNSDPCVPCTTNCSGCNAAQPSNCTSCKPGYYSLANNTCNSCPSLCAVCTSSTNCTICNTGYILAVNGSCVSNSVLGVDPNCISTNGSLLTCTACATGYVLARQSCFKCSNNGGITYAATCSPPPTDVNGNDINSSQVTTTSCLIGSYATPLCSGMGPICVGLYPNSPNECLPNGCAPGYYNITTNSYFGCVGCNAVYSCAACAIGCTSCTNSSFCYSCTTGYYLLNNVCTPCSSNCLTCITNASYCTSCPQGYVINGTLCSNCQLVGGPTGTCNCPNGTYWSGFSCQNCITGCNICSSTTGCITCGSNSIYDPTKNICITPSDPNCVAIYYTSIAMPTTCKICAIDSYLDSNSSSCTLCSSKIPNCKSCSSNSICILCYTGYYTNSASTCSACNISLPNCDTCSSTTKCDQCSLGYFWNSSLSACVACGYGCSVCSNTSSCLICGNGFTFINGSCQLCPPGCATCLTYLNCTSCTSRYYYVNQSAQCSPCSSLCNTCTSSGSNNCTSCIGNATFPIGVLSGPNGCSCVARMTYSASTGSCIPVGSTSFGKYLFAWGVCIIAILIAIF